MAEICSIGVAAPARLSSSNNQGVCGLVELELTCCDLRYAAGCDLCACLAAGSDDFRYRVVRSARYLGLRLRQQDCRQYCHGGSEEFLQNIFPLTRYACGFHSPLDCGKLDRVCRIQVKNLATRLQFCWLRKYPTLETPPQNRSGKSDLA